MWQLCGDYQKTFSGINEDAVKEFVRKAKTAKRIDFDFIDVKSTLNKLHLLDKKRLTMAAEVLFCDDNPMEIQDAIFAGIDKLTFLDIKGNEVAIFKDRIEIYNPGLFPAEINPEDFFTGEEHSILRNPLIAETMYKSKDIERWGSHSGEI